MSPRRERTPQRGLASLLWTAFGLTAVTIVAGAGQPAAAVPQSALEGCAGIAADPDRLACYDRLAGRAVPGAAPVLRASPAAAAPGVAAAPSAAAAALPPSQAAFGLYEAEHPKAPPVAATLHARVVAVGRGTDGRMSVSLEGGAVWELDEADPLLAAGDSVTLTRAAFGSYIMHTPTGRAHRALRLR